MKKSKRGSGVYAMQSESYHLPIRAAYILQKADRSWWASPPVIVLLTLFLSVLDALVLFDIMDAAMVQSAWLGSLVAFGIALVLNIIPLALAKLLHQAIYRLKRHAGKLAAVLLAAFVLLFSATVYLRFAFSERYEPENTTDLLVNTMADAGEEPADPETQARNQAQATAVVVLLSVEPLVTSITNFLLAFLTDDELRSRIYGLKLRRLELLESISDLQAAQANLEGNRQSLLQLDEARYQAARKVLEDRCNVLRARARILLAERLADPHSISRLSAQSVTLTQRDIPPMPNTARPMTSNTQKEEIPYEIPV